jgi:hypothetical protein
MGVTECRDGRAHVAQQVRSMIDAAQQQCLAAKVCAHEVNVYMFAGFACQDRTFMQNILQTVSVRCKSNDW